MNLLWLIGQAGIVLEIGGAGYIVYCAYTAKAQIHGKKTDLDHLQEALDTVIAEVASQFRKQLFGFVLLVLGLGMQFVGNLSGM